MYGVLITFIFSTHLYIHTYLNSSREHHHSMIALSHLNITFTFSDMYKNTFYYIIINNNNNNK